MRTAIFLCLIAQCCAAQTIAYVANALGTASSRINVVAPGMLATVSEMPGFRLASSQWFIGPSAITATVFIRPFGSASALPANVIAAQTSTATFVVPLGLPYGTAELAWSIGGAPLQTVNVTIARSNFEVQRIGSFGPALAQVMLSGDNIVQNGLANPAKPGQTLMLFGSGLGSGTTVTATIGGARATVYYSGRDGVRTGYDQIQVQVPAGIADGCYVPLSLTAGTLVSSSTVSVTSDGMPCRHPFDLTLSDMKTLDDGGAIETGEISLNTAFDAVLASAVSREESATLNVSQKSASDIAAYFRAGVPTSATACGGYDSAAAGVFALFGSLLGSVPVEPAPSIGNSVTLTGPGSAVTLNSSDGVYFSSVFPIPEDGSLESPPAPTIAGGKWTWSSEGSERVPASSFAFTLPAPFQFNAGAPLSIRRDQDQVLTWNGTGFDSATSMFLTLRTDTRAISCIAPAASGTVTIPAALMASFPPTSIGSLNGNVSLTGAAMPHGIVKTKSGSTVLMVVSWTSSDSRPADFR